MRKIIILSTLVLTVLACTEQKNDIVSVSGSTTVLPVVSTAADMFMKQNPGSKIIVNAGGSGVGVNQVGSQRVEIGMISRDITEKEISQYPNTCLLYTSPSPRD